MFKANLGQTLLKHGTGVLLLGLLAACGGGGGGGSTAPANNPPTVDAGPDQSANENAIVQLAGSGSDSDGGTVSFSWSQVSGPTGEFGSTTAADTTFTAPLVAVGAEESIVLRLTANDGQGGSTSDDLTITAASADFVVFLADKDTDQINELFRYDTQTDTLSKLNDVLIANGRVLDYAISPDGESVAYRADQETQGVTELYVATIDGSGVIKLNAGMANAAGNVVEYQWSPDSAQIVYSADADIANITEVYLADRDGGNHVKINGSVGASVVFLQQPTWSPDGRYVAQLVVETGTNRRLGINTHDTQVGGFSSVRVTSVPSFGNVASFGWAPDSSVVAYIADQETDNVNELFSALPDGSGTAKLNPTLVSGGIIVSFQWAPDGSRIAYRATQETASVVEIFSALPDGGSNMKLNGMLAAGSSVSIFEWAPDSSNVAYLAAQDTAGIAELYASSADGANNIKLNSPMHTTASVAQFAWAPDSSRIAYRSNQESALVFEIFATAADGSMNVKLSETLGANGVTAFTAMNSFEMWSPNSAQFVYPVDLSGTSVFEHYAADQDGTSQTQVTVTPAGFLSSFARWSADSSSLIYASSQDIAGVTELYLASADGLNNTKISGTMVAGGNIFLNRGVLSRTFDWSP